MQLLMNIALTIISICLILASMLLGLFLCFYSAVAIELQRRFYAAINWKIEPISLAKELRNTRIMGGFLAAFSLLALALSILFK